MLTNNQERYGLISKALHWLMALMILTLIGVGFYMTGLDKEDPSRGQFYGLHKAFGVTVLWLAALRIAWILFSRPPELPAVLQRWEKTLSKAVAGLMYLLMMVVPIVGYVMSNAAGKPISYFGAFELPALVAPSKGIAGVANIIHGYLAYTVLALVVLHVAGAIKHRVVDKDPEADVLKRML